MKSLKTTSKNNLKKTVLSAFAVASMLVSVQAYAACWEIPGGYKCCHNGTCVVWVKLK